MATYKVITQKDRYFSGKFSPEKLEAAINSYAEQGWRRGVHGDCLHPRLR